MISGQFFTGHDSRAHPAQLQIGIDGFVRVQGLPVPRSVRLSAVEISDRIASVPRRIRFADGAVFETADNDGVDAALEALGQAGFAGRVARWELRWQVAVGALFCVALISWMFVRFGVPLLANIAARTLPPALDKAIGVQGLDILDHSLLTPSSLPAARQAQLRARFEEIVSSVHDAHDYRLEFRSGERIGANAFALPAGIVVVTDDLVKLAHSDDEIVAVLAHEVGHVRGRHALRRLLQSAGVAALALAVLGDVSSVSALASAVPVALIQAGHSRDFEREADAFAKQWLTEHGIPRSRFDSLLCRLEAVHRARKGGSGSTFGYLSSHPPTEERADCSQVEATTHD